MCYKLSRISETYLKYKTSLAPASLFFFHEIEVVPITPAIWSCGEEDVLGFEDSSYGPGYGSWARQVTGGRVALVSACVCSSTSEFLFGKAAWVRSFRL